jgi:hypothetical protein
MQSGKYAVFDEKLPFFNENMRNFVIFGFFVNYRGRFQAQNQLLIVS